MINGKLFHTLAFDVGKMTHNSGMCVLTVDNETYFRKLAEVIEVEYFDRTKYVMFKCDWTKNTRDRGEQITDEPYMLTSQVDQILGLRCKD